MPKRSRPPEDHATVTPPPTNFSAPPPPREEPTRQVTSPETVRHLRELSHAFAAAERARQTPIPTGK